MRPTLLRKKKELPVYVACAMIPLREIELLNHHVEWAQLKIIYDTQALLPDHTVTVGYLRHLEYKTYKRPTGEGALIDRHLRMAAVWDVGYDIRVYPHRAASNPILMITQRQDRAWIPAVPTKALINYCVLCKPTFLALQFMKTQVRAHCSRAYGSIVGDTVQNRQPFHYSRTVGNNTDRQTMQ